ncbi:hypothetical protein KJ786_03235 [Patescibacteria group bacterium]|nr:hypothetical protein [Patescibacteria group bacterium]
MKRFFPIIIIIVIIIALTLSGMSFFESFKNEKSSINKLGIELKDIGRFLTAQLVGYSGSVNTNVVAQNNNQINPSTSPSAASNSPVGSKNKPLITYNYDYVPPVVKKAVGQSNSYVPQTNTQILPEAIDTFIISGPNNGDILESTENITFKFDAQIPADKNNQQVTFETMVYGLDSNWQTAYGKERTIYLPAESKSYVFSVRVKVGNLVDKTPAIRTFSIKVSPYFGKIKVSSVENKTNPSSSLITLGAYFYNENKIDITGWSIESMQGKFPIPQGMEKYNPSNTFTSNIFVKSGDRIYLSSSQNPLGRDNNFRLNKCLGYLKNYQTFPIYFYDNCPRTENYEVTSLRSSCQNYILVLGTCEIPDYGSNYAISTDSQCTSYINDNFSYSGCVSKHSKDQDFFQNEWHIYMNQNLINRSVDTIILRDKSGLLVDKHTYRIY